MYSIIRTIEREGISPGHKVFVRIHRGCTDVLEHYWDDWNKNNPGKFREDEAVKTEIPSLFAAVQELRRYC